MNGGGFWQVPSSFASAPGLPLLQICTSGTARGQCDLRRGCVLSTCCTMMTISPFDPLLLQIALTSATGISAPPPASELRILPSLPSSTPPSLPHCHYHHPRYQPHHPQATKMHPTRSRGCWKPGFGQTSECMSRPGIFDNFAC